MISISSAVTIRSIADIPSAFASNRVKKHQQNNHAIDSVEYRNQLGGGRVGSPGKNSACRSCRLSLSLDIPARILRTDAAHGLDCDGVLLMSGAR